MELFRTNDFYIFVNGEYSLWWDRQTGVFIPKTGWDLTDADDPVCLGLCDGIIGKVEHSSLLNPRLLLIKESLPVGKIHGENDVFKIKSVIFLPLSPEDTELNLIPCNKHKTLDLKQNTNSGLLFDIQKNTAFTKTWGTLKNAGSTIKHTTRQAAAMATGVPRKHNSKDRECFEKQIIEEFYKIFTDTNSFYYSHTIDLTNSLQRKCNLQKQNLINTKALWKTVDDRFFWNKHMLKCIIESANPLCDPWVLPIIQGYIQIESCRVAVGRGLEDNLDKDYETFTLCILSRRSRFRAGTRYKKRGVDESGAAANYVETEQIVTYQSHEVSFVQVRGSVPIYWSQPGIKYRPPPRIDKGEAETKAALEKHFNGEIQKYGPVCVVNLIDQTGKEKIIFDAYSNYILEYDSPFITYVTFDFHEYCRGMHFENVSILINGVSDVIKDMNYCWRDAQGHICSQNGVFRVNCIDCLDRTNVVQTALGKVALEMQFCKLGLISPEDSMPNSIKNTFQLLWANNGDIISKQYAGTNALKGDYTRTGERKIAGIMKDGMNSANRFYLSRFKDSARQGAIDIMLGNYVSEDIFSESKAVQYEEDSAQTAEHVKLLLEDCKKILINQPKLVVGSWGLINANHFTGNPNETEMDSILILTKDSYFVADYDDQVDKITKYQKVLLKDLTLLELGMAEWSNSLFKASKHRYCMRFNYKINNATGYYHMFRSTNLRFFNNMTVIIKNVDEEIESLKAICEYFIMAVDICGLPPIPFKHGQILDRRKAKVISADIYSGNIYLDTTGLTQMTQNASENQLFSVKSVGSKAISNMTQQFSKLNKISSSFKHSKTNANFSIEHHKNETSSDSDEVSENSIFQPDVSMEGRKCLHYKTEYNCNRSNNSIEAALEATEESITPYLKVDSVLPGVGIVMGNKNNSDSVEGVLQKKENLLSRIDSSQLDDIQLSSIMQNLPVNSSINPTPEIQINSKGFDLTNMKSILPNTLKLDKKFSHSSEEIRNCKDIVQHKTDESRLERSISDYEVQMNISQSLSESALKKKFNSMSSPVASATKEFMLSPFSKLAKGVQNIGANLDPRKLSGQLRQITQKEIDEYKKLQEKWQHSKTRFIAL